MSKSLLVKPNYVRIYGHRGARGDIVENSIEGFKYTFNLGIKAIEFDVVISKDNILQNRIYFKNLMNQAIKSYAG